jgi:hypothetical protein
MGKMVRAGAVAEIFNKLEPEGHKKGPAPQHWISLQSGTNKTKQQNYLVHSIGISLLLSKVVKLFLLVDPSH